MSEFVLRQHVDKAVDFQTRAASREISEYDSVVR